MRTLSKKEAERNKRLLRTYGISLNYYEALFQDQGGKCAICGWEPREDTRPLHVEHDHSYSKVKLTTVKKDGVWHSSGEYKKITHLGLGSTKSEAVQAVKVHIKSASVRGLTCWACNRMLKDARDNPAILRKAAKYLDRHNGD